MTDDAVPHDAFTPAGASADPVTFALVTPTRSRRDPLRRLLESLTRQEHRHFTVYLGDQNVAGEIQDIIDAYSTQISIHHAPMLPAGISKARNALLKLVKEDVIILTDDDCHYPPETFAQLARAFSENPGADIIIGRWLEKKPTASSEHGQHPVTSRYGMFSNASSIVLFFRKRVFEHLIFDESMGIGCPSHIQSGEETDLLLRAHAAGFSIFRDDSIIVRHDNSIPGSPSTLRKVEDYGVGRMYLLKKHRFPLWFMLANITFPLLRLIMEGPSHYQYRWRMFIGRCKGLLTTP